MKEYISLGSNCAIAYQLYYYNIRKYGYPFDWSTSTINQLLAALTDNCKDYTESLNILNFSNNHAYIKFNTPYNNLLTNIGSYKCRNKYGITMSHELIKQNDFNLVKEKINRRLNRLYNLDKIDNLDEIIYLRVEVKIVSIDSYANSIKELFKYLDILSKGNSYKLKLILHKNNNELYTILNDYINKNILEIYYYDKFSLDWKMDRMNWKKILELEK